MLQHRKTCCSFHKQLEISLICHMNPVFFWCCQVLRVLKSAPAADNLQHEKVKCIQQHIWEAALHPEQSELIYTSRASSLYQTALTASLWKTPGWRGLRCSRRLTLLCIQVCKHAENTLFEFCDGGNFGVKVQVQALRCECLWVLRDESGVQCIQRRFMGLL